MLDGFVVVQVVVCWFVVHAVWLTAVLCRFEQHDGLFAGRISCVLGDCSVSVGRWHHDGFLVSLTVAFGSGCL